MSWWVEKLLEYDGEGFVCDYDGSIDSHRILKRSTKYYCHKYNPLNSVGEIEERN